MVDVNAVSGNVQKRDETEMPREDKLYEKRDKSTRKVLQGDLAFVIRLAKSKLDGWISYYRYYYYPRSPLVANLCC